MGNPVTPVFAMLTNDENWNNVAEQNNQQRVKSYNENKQRGQMVLSLFDLAGSKAKANKSLEQHSETA